MADAGFRRGYTRIAPLCLGRGIDGDGDGQGLAVVVFRVQRGDGPVAAGFGLYGACSTTLSFHGVSDDAIVAGVGASAGRWRSAGGKALRSAAHFD